MKNLSTKNGFRLIGVILAFLLAVSVFSGFGVYANAAQTAQSKEVSYSSLAISNNQFAETSSDDYPQIPESWTGEALNGRGGDVTSGVITLKSAEYKENYDDIKLGIYPEYADKDNTPQTPFGNTNTNPVHGNYYPGTNKNVLMINSPIQTAYGYATQELSLDANGFYKFSVWVKTGAFSQNQGASIVLEGMEETAGIFNISTKQYSVLDHNNKYGWENYQLYVGVGPNTESVKLRLSLGYDDNDKHVYPSKGYVFFDNVTAGSISPSEFYRAVKAHAKNDKVVFYNMNSDNFLTNDNGDEIGSFSNDGKGWTVIDGNDEDDVNHSYVSKTANVFYHAVNNTTTFIEGNAIGLTSDPYTPRGKSDDTNKIMIISSYSAAKDAYGEASFGVRSDDITIKRGKYYSLSAWVNTQEASSDGAALVITGEGTRHYADYELTGANIGDIVSDGNTNRYGWVRKIFYIVGSTISDRTINLELWLGYDNPAKGVVMFDDITLDEITYAEYSDNSYGATTLSMDDYASDMSSSDSINGKFFAIKNSDDTVFPAEPESWTFITPDTANTQGGYEALKTETENAVYGLMPTNDEHFEANKHNYLTVVNNPLPGASKAYNKNLLLMASKEDTAFGYRSSALTISAETDYTLTVKLKADMAGYGANLILKNGDYVMAQIENITKTDNFSEFTFYILGASTDATLSVEIWFGLNNLVNSPRKLASGTLLVDSVTLTSLTADEETSLTVADEKFEEYKLNPVGKSYAAYKIGEIEPTAFDRYAPGDIKPVYTWSITSGTTEGIKAGAIPSVIGAGNTTVPAYFRRAHNEYCANNTTYFSNVIYLENVHTTYSQYTSSNTIGLSKEGWFKIDVSILVDIGEEADEKSVGAGITLGELSFKNIRNTYKSTPIHTDEGIKHDFEFKTYSFYYATGAEDESLNLAISLGGNELTNQAIRGRVMVNNVTVTAIDNTTFDAETADAEDNEFIVVKTNTTDSEEEETPPEEEQPEQPTDPNAFFANPWYVVPSAIFAVAVIVAFAVILIKKLGKKHAPRKRKAERVMSYDRNETLHKQGEPEAEENAPTVKASDNVFDSFDDDLSMPKEQPRPTEVVPEKEVPNAVPVEEATPIEKADEEIKEFDD